MTIRKIYTVVLFIIVTKFSLGQNPVVVNLLNDVELDSLIYFVKQLSGEEQVIINGVPDTIFSRQMDQPGNEIAFQYAKGKFTDYGLQIDSLQFSATGKNLFGIQLGTLYPDRKLMVGAHYDNVGFTVAPGADDNASGTAAVIEAARIFSNYSFPFTIVFALWDEEEQGLVGSMAYTSSISSSGENIIGYINMDMLGWDGNNDSIADLNVRPVANSLLLADKAIQANTNYNIGLGLHIVNPGNGATDHASFWTEGLTAIGIDEEYDNDFNPHWHTTADSLGQFNIDYYQMCAKLVYATLSECALDSTSQLGTIEYAENSINVYPNPAKKLLTIQLDNGLKNNIGIQLYNSWGQLVKEEIFMSIQKEYTVDIETLPQGIYTINVVQGNRQIITKRWVKTM